MALYFANITKKQGSYKGGRRMPNQNEPSQEKLNAMLKMASSKLGMSPDQLKNVLNDKNKTNELLNKIGGQNSFNQAMKNPESLEKMINENPQAKKILGDLLNKK